MLTDNGQMTGSLYKGASSEAQGDQHAVKIALIFYYSIWPTIALPSHLIRLTSRRTRL